MLKYKILHCGWLRGGGQDNKGQDFAKLMLWFFSGWLFFILLLFFYFIQILNRSTCTDGINTVYTLLENEVHT